MSDPRWITGDVPRPDQTSVPVQTVSPADMKLYEETLAAIALAQTNRLAWEHFVLEAITASRHLGRAEMIDESEAPTDITMLIPDARALAAPTGDTSYSTPVVPTLDEQLAAYLTSDLPVTE